MKKDRKHNGWYRVVDDESNPVFDFDFDSQFEAIEYARKYNKTNPQALYVWHIFLTNKIEPKGI